MKDEPQAGAPDTYDPLAAKLHSTTDARVWAEEFCRIFTGFVVGGTGPYGLEEGTMVGWFANAIETGRDAGRRSVDEDFAKVWRPGDSKHVF